MKNENESLREKLKSYFLIFANMANCFVKSESYTEIIEHSPSVPTCKGEGLKHTNLLHITKCGKSVGFVLTWRETYEMVGLEILHQRFLSVKHLISCILVIVLPILAFSASV